jgi:predicted DNA-binding protein with PD1-like motif
MKVVPLRLQPGDDLRRSLEAWTGAQQEQAGCVISAIGSLAGAQLRLAGAAATAAIWRTSAWPERCQPMEPTCRSPSLMTTAP